MVGICRVRAAYPFHGMAPEGWILWAVLHECGLTEQLGCPNGSGTPRTVRCPGAGRGTTDAEGDAGEQGSGEAPDERVREPPPVQPEELDAFELLT